MSKKIIKHELFEVLVPANTTLNRFPIPDLPNLREVELWSVQCYYKKIVPFSVLSQRATIDKVIFQNSFLTLVNYDGMEFLKQAPFVIFQTIENNMVEVPLTTDPLVVNECTIQEKDFKSFVGQKVNYPKSYIEVSQPTLNTTDIVYLISIGYVDPKQVGKKQTTFREKN